MSSQLKRASSRQGFKVGEYIIYPSQGVGQILVIEEQEVAGHRLELFVIYFVKDKLHLKVPVARAVASRMRKLSDTACIDKALKVLQGRAKIKRIMWSRRAQEYVAKINSGDILAVAEVVRDLYRSETQPDQSYSERQLYESALSRIACEIAAVHKLSETEAVRLIENNLSKNVARRTMKNDSLAQERQEILEGSDTIECEQAEAA